MKRIAMTLAVIAISAMTTGASRHHAALRCTLTGKTINSCCCTMAANGNLHCTLANKDIKECCCESAK